MKCQAPERLDKNGNVKQEYIDFMKQIPSPEERANMTDDEILDWFISRRGGTRECLKWKIGKALFNLWIEISNRPGDYLNTNIPIKSKALKSLDKYLNKINDNRKNWTKERIIQWFKDRNWLGFDNEENLLRDFYEAFTKLHIDDFRKDFKWSHWEEDIIEWTGFGIDLDNWYQLKHKCLPKELILNQYCIDGHSKHSCIERFNN